MLGIELDDINSGCDTRWYHEFESRYGISLQLFNKFQ